jgi:hypothetical protein
MKGKRSPVRFSPALVIASLVYMGVSLVAIGYLSMRIIALVQRSAGNKPSAVIPFQKDTLSRPESDLPGFYEPKANTVNEMTPDWLGKKVEHHINSDGLRDKNDYEKDKPADVFRIAVMGDSFTYGLFVGDDDPYAEKLEVLANTKGQCDPQKKIEVINFGVPGYDLEMSAYRYDFRVKDYSPDLVVWYLIENDFDEYNSLVQDLWVNIKEMLVAENIPYERFAPETAEILESVVTGRLGDTYIPEHQIQKLREWAERIDIPFVIVTDSSLPKKYHDAVAEVTAKYSNGRHLDTIRYDNAFSEGHPSPASHAIIATSIFTYLKKESLLPCAFE